MLALTIMDIKDFMNKLLIGDVFDHFSLVEAAITTFNIFSIDGRLQQDFFDSDTKDSLREKCMEYSIWRDIKPFCFSIIRGKRTPLNFKIILQVPQRQVHKFLAENKIILPDNICSFYLNLQYKNKSLLCTSGVSYSSFLPDRSLEHLWDDYLTGFLTRHGILFQSL
ncbi:MAG: DUF5721 family protein [Clostridia bacterium]|nr:DUF5721 family protein [Clostridia bacterium]MDY5555874.1 DUF5721 family protein [Blautia sp.]